MTDYIIWGLLAALNVVVIGAFVFKGHLHRKRRKELLARPLGSVWVGIIEEKVPVYNYLPDELKKQLQGLVNVFLDEKRFVGCNGLAVTEEMKVIIAAQACVLLLGRETNYYPKLKTIYIYPETYVAKGGGTSTARLGESWQNGPVVLAWDSVQGGARNVYDGKNVVFHEFSHRLDQEDGDADGAPILENRSCYQSWAKVLGGEYEALQGKMRGRRRSVLNKYGATNPAEFFAVATEAFFEKPKQMKKKQPELYEELKSYFKVDPVEWNG